MINIERAHPQDAGIIMDVTVRAFDDEMRRILGRDGGPPGYREIATYVELIDKFWFYKILHEGKIIGAFFLVEKEKGHIRLENFCIMPSCQNRGFGRRALELMEEQHPDIGKWSLSAAKDSRRIWHLYEKFGYVRTGETQWEYGYEKRCNSK